jgi:hypothetical protein
MSDDDKRDPDHLEHGASPRHVEEGARPSQRPIRPQKPPTGPSGGSDAISQQHDE